MTRPEIYKGCKAGDREALGALYRLYMKRMRELVGRYVSDPERVDDVVHDGFIIIFSSMGSLRDPANMEAWMGKIMRNLALKAESMKRREVAFDENALPETGCTEEVAADIPLEEIYRIIDRLPEGYRNVFRLSVLEGLSHKQIGEMLGIAERSSSSQLARARQMLRSMINDYRLNMMTLLMLLAAGGLVTFLISRRASDAGGASDGSTRPAGVSEGIAQEKPHENARKTAVSAKPKKIQNATTTPSHTPERKPEAADAAQDGAVQSEISVSAPDTITVPEEKQPDAKETDNIPTTLPADHTFLASADEKASGASGWNIDLGSTFSSLARLTSGENSREINSGDGDVTEENPAIIQLISRTRQQHYVPIVISLSASKELSRRWAIESGLRYTLLRSTFKSESEIEKVDISQRVHYVGIPLKFSYRFLSTGRLSAYAQAGFGLDIPVKATRKGEVKTKEMKQPIRMSMHVNAPLQWSAEAGAGIEYRFTPHVGLFAEPQIVYYFDTSGKIRTVFNDRRFTFSVPVGLRFSW